MSLGELVDLRRRVAAVGQGADETGWRAQGRSSPVGLADETGWRAQGRHSSVWQAGTPAGVRSFAYPHRRAGAIINALLGDEFRGVVVRDCYAASNDTPGGQHQRGVGSICCATCTPSSALTPTGPRGWPGRRRSSASTGRPRPPRAGCARAARGLRVANPSPPPGRPASQPPPGHASARQTLYERLVTTAARLGAQVAQVKGHPCPALAQRLLRHQGELGTFVCRDDVPADNNGAERGVRPVVVGRTISGGSRSGPGSHTRMVLTSRFETWRAQGHHPLVTCRRLLQGPLPVLC